MSTLRSLAGYTTDNAINTEILENLGVIIKLKRLLHIGRDLKVM
jgi:hypothetical protein